MFSPGNQQGVRSREGEKYRGNPPHERGGEDSSLTHNSEGGREIPRTTPPLEANAEIPPGFLDNKVLVAAIGPLADKTIISANATQVMTPVRTIPFHQRLMSKSYVSKSTSPGDLIGQLSLPFLFE